VSKELVPNNNTITVANGIQARLNKFLAIDKGVKSVMLDRPKLLRTGIQSLDAILGGGAIVGGLIQLVGRAGCGKSSLAAKILSSFQKASNGQSLSLYIDSESTMSKYRLCQLGVNYPAIDPIPDVTLEDVFAIIEAVVEFKKNNKDAMDIPAVIVWDSIANTLSKKEMTAEDPKEVIGYKARLLSLYLPRISPLLPEYGITVIAVNQLRDAVGIGMTPTPVAIKGMKQADTIPGGRALQFATSQLLYMMDSGNIEERVQGFDGKEVEAYCIKNKAFPPLIKTKMAFSYMGGYSDFWSSFALLKEQKLIVANGAWYSMKGFDQKFQGSTVAKFFMESEGFRTSFSNLITAYNKSVVDKYTNQLESCNIDDVLERRGAIGDHLIADETIKNATVIDITPSVEDVKKAKAAKNSPKSKNQESPIQPNVNEVPVEEQQSNDEISDVEVDPTIPDVSVPMPNVGDLKI